MEEKICKNCFFWRRHNSVSDEGKCHRHAPQFQRSTCYWQRGCTRQTDWCGEFRPAKAPAASERKEFCHERGVYCGEGGVLGGNKTNESPAAPEQEIKNSQ